MTNLDTPYNVERGNEADKVYRGEMVCLKEGVCESAKKVDICGLVRGSRSFPKGYSASGWRKKRGATRCVNRDDLVE